MLILDNVFSEQIQREIEYNIFHNIKFYHKQHAVTGKKSILHSDSDFWCHMVCDGEEKSGCFDNIISTFNPVFKLIGKHFNKDKLEVERIKINLFNPSIDPRPLPFHVDSPQKHIVGLYYVNNSDGATIIGKRFVSPKRGRFVMFDGSTYHTHFLSKFSKRSTINFNLT
jgi:hypothetical protein